MEEIPKETSQWPKTLYCFQMELEIVRQKHIEQMCGDRLVLLRRCGGLQPGFGFWITLQLDVRGHFFERFG